MKATGNGNIDLDALRERYDLRDVLVDGAGKRRKYVLRHCPVEIHGRADHDASLCLNRDYWFCFGCGKSGDIFTWAELVHVVSFPDAVKLVETGRFGKGTVLSGEAGARARTHNEYSAAFKREWYGYTNGDQERFVQRLHDQMPEEKRSWFLHRGIAEQVVDNAVLGWHSGGCFVIPVWDGENQLCGVKLRRDDLVVGEGTKYDGCDVGPLFGERNLEAAVWTGELLVLTEGELDALAVESAGFLSASFTGGCRGAKAAIADGKGEDLRRLSRLLVAMDADAQGAETQSMIVHGLEKKVPVVKGILWPDGKDATDYIVAHGVQAFQGLVGAAMTAGKFRRIWTKRA